MTTRRTGHSIIEHPTRGLLTEWDNPNTGRRVMSPTASRADERVSWWPTRREAIRALARLMARGQVPATGCHVLTWDEDRGRWLAAP